MSLLDRFKIDYTNAKSNEKLIIKGNNYRFTILSEILIRIEYSKDGNFEDRPTEFARMRNFPVFNYLKQEDENYLVIETNYFKLEYTKNKPFYGSKFSPD